MASSELVRRMDTATRDLKILVNIPHFTRIKSSSVLYEQFTSAQELAEKWLARAMPFRDSLDDEVLQPLVLFAEQLAQIADRQQQFANEAIPDSIRRVRSDFTRALSPLIYEILDMYGIATLSPNDYVKERSKAIADIDAHLKEELEKIYAEIKSKADEAVAEFELAKEKASRISIDSAQKQFSEASSDLRNKSLMWACVSLFLSATLIATLICMSTKPPQLVGQIVNSMRPGTVQPSTQVSIPLLITASAYFTSIRLALIGAISVGLAFSLKMTRAYLHMIEHNRHKLRVANSIEAFVAAVRTKEQKDLVLAKLIESVTEFGDSGILSKQGEGSAFPSIAIEALTKNIDRNN